MASQSSGWRAPEDPVVSPRLAADLPHWHCGRKAEGLSERSTCGGKDKNVGDSRSSECSQLFKGHRSWDEAAAISLCHRVMLGPESHHGKSREKGGGL